MATTLATELRRNFDQASARLPEEALARVARARDTRNAGPAERDQLLAEIVAAYRCGPAELWAPVILDLLAPALVGILRRVDRRSHEIADMWDHHEPLVVDEDEVRQQLVLEVLRAAATIPLHPTGRAMKTRLLRRANRYLVRWLRRDFRHQIWHCSLEALLELEDERSPFGAGNPLRRTRGTTSPADGN
jgi:hypothetical protein